MPDSDQSDVEIWESIRHSTMDELAQEIGRMCLYWSELEMSVSLFLSILLQISDKTSHNVVIGAMDFRSKLQAILPLAFERKPTEPWYDKVATIVNHIDKDLRTERNRIIHDYWFQLPEHQEPRKMRFQSKVINVQSRTKKLQLAEIKPFSAKQVGLLYAKMIRARKIVNLLQTEASQHLPSPEIPRLPTRTPNPDQD